MAANRKLQALVHDCDLLKCLFLSATNCANHQDNFKDLRAQQVEHALNYLRLRRERVKWIVGPKQLDFEGAFKDYRVWKNKTKCKTLDTLGANLVKHYQKLGMRAEQARKEVCGTRDSVSIEISCTTFTV